MDAYEKQQEDDLGQNIEAKDSELVRESAKLEQTAGKAEYKSDDADQDADAKSKESLKSWGNREGMYKEDLCLPEGRNWIHE